MKTKFIINPVAGGGKGRRIWRKVSAVLDGEGYSYAHTFTSHPGEAVALSRRAATKGFDVVAAVGGDGTVNEVANGIIGSDAALGIVPAGTGCDYIRSLAIPRDPLGAVRTIFSGYRQIVDLGRVNDRYFLGVTGMGIDAEVCRRVNKNLSYLWGKTAYIVGLVATLATYHPQPVRIELDKETIKAKATLVAVANARYFGGGMLIAPQANLFDGLLDICVVQGLSKVEMMRVFPRIFSGRHTRHPSFQAFRSRRVNITGKGTCAIQAEGELIGTLPLQAEVVPGALAVMVGGHQSESAC